MDIRIYQAVPGTELTEKLLAFVRNSSWDEVKAHTADMIAENAFTDWEAMFAAADGNEIVGHASFMKTDYYPAPEIFPWISTVFVTERYRGMGICGMLIEHINQYARTLGFDRTYIPSEHFGLYEKYGYVYLKDIVNYGGGTDHLFVKMLSEL